MTRIFFFKSKIDLKAFKVEVRTQNFILDIGILENSIQTGLQGRKVSELDPSLPAFCLTV